MRKEGLVSLAIDVGGSHVTVALVKNKTIMKSILLDTDPTLSFQICLDSIEEACLALLTQSHMTLEDIIGLGIAVPMLVNSSNNKVITTASEKYSDAGNIDLINWADRCFGKPLILEVDAHAACIGEWLYGSGQGAKDLVYVIIGTGYGCSVVINGMPLRGRNNLAGIRGGHITVNAGPNRIKCVCPGSGCAESEIGSWSIEQKAKRDSSYHTSSLSRYTSLNYKILFREAEKNDALAVLILEENLRYLAVSLVNLINSYNPEKIILAGGIMNKAQIILPKVKKHIHDNVWSDNDYPEVVEAIYPETAALLGLHAMMIQQIHFL